MNREEAKQLLELCRPGNEDDRQDPSLAEAFALLETDPELQTWFDEQQAVDAQISESINSIEVPADLKASILAGMRLHQAHAEQTNPDSSATEVKMEAAIPFAQPSAQPSAQHSQPVNTSNTSDASNTSGTTRSRAWWQSPWTGIAALFVIMMAVMNVPKSEQTTGQAAVAGLPPVIQFLSNKIDSLSMSQFDLRDNHADNLQTYLASTHSPSPASIPEYIRKMPTAGCITYEYEGAKFSMICFKGGETYHLITADKATYPDALPLEPEVFQCSGKAFKVWVDGEQVKILSVKGTKENIPEFI